MNSPKRPRFFTRGFPHSGQSSPMGSGSGRGTRSALWASSTVRENSVQNSRTTSNQRRRVSSTSSSSCSIWAVKPASTMEDRSLRSK